MADLFERASRAKLRFDSTGRGTLSAEDLWDLPLRHLDMLAVGLQGQLESTSKISFISEGPRTDAALQLRFDVAKHVIDVRLAEMAEAATAAERAQRRQKLLGALARLEEAEIDGMSKEDIEKALAE